MAWLIKELSQSPRMVCGLVTYSGSSVLLVVCWYSSVIQLLRYGASGIDSGGCTVVVVLCSGNPPRWCSVV